MGILYVVSTPIGNLEDVTLRAIRVLKSVDLIAAEDTRTTKRLLSQHSIETPMTSFHDRNSRGKTPRLLRDLSHRDVALVSEAGTPGISDPGYDLVKGALELGFPVLPVPGVSAVTAALAISGLPIHQFTYLGFLPRRPGPRRRVLQSLSEENRTVVAFESPHRLIASLQDILAIFGDRPISVCREMTKLYEEIFRGTVAGAIAQFPRPRGEFTIVLGLDKRMEANPPRAI